MSEEVASWEGTCLAKAQNRFISPQALGPTLQTPVGLV